MKKGCMYGLILILILGTFSIFILVDETTADDKVIRIMPLGDSITRGRWGSTWRLYLRRSLTNKAKVKVDFVGSCPHAPNFGELWSDHYRALKEALDGDIEHEGWGALRIGDITRFVIKEQSPDRQKRFIDGKYRDFTIEELLSRNPADIILLMIGTNDFFGDYEILSAPERLNILINKIAQNSKAYLFVSSIPPIYGKAEQKFDEKVRAYNTRVSDIIRSFQSRGFKIGYVDMFGHLDREDMLSDGLHPNIWGDQKIGHLWYTAIYPYVKGLTK